MISLSERPCDDPSRVIASRSCAVIGSAQTWGAATAAMTISTPIALSIRVLIVCLPYDHHAVELPEVVRHEVLRLRRRHPSDSIDQIHERMFALSQRHIDRPE